MNRKNNKNSTNSLYIGQPIHTNFRHTIESCYSGYRTTNHMKKLSQVHTVTHTAFSYSDARTVNITQGYPLPYTKVQCSSGQPLH